MKRVYIIAGEASGDLHGSNLIKGLKLRDPSLEIQAWGGELMEQAGAKLRKHYRDLAFMGFVEVLLNIRAILSNLRFCKQDIERFNPDLIILIDYPGFNLRIAKWAKPKKYKVHYYIAPQIWAWNTSRVHKIAQNTDKIISILPFEQEFYARHGSQIDYVGHPLLDAVKQFRSDPTFAERLEKGKKIIALLPGSRKQEIKRMLPIMLKMLDRFKDALFVIAGSPNMSPDYYKQFYSSSSSVLVVSNETYNLLSVADAALVSSGTATLETALFGVPQVVCYKGNPLSYVIAKRLIKVKYISLVNLILDRPALTELIQNDFNVASLERELNLILSEEHRLHEDYEEVKRRLGNVGASDRAAQIILKNIR